MSRKFIVYIALLSLSFGAQAGLYLEPYLGLELGKQTDTNVNESLVGTHVGGKLGWSYFNMAFGLDYMRGNLSAKESGQTDKSTSRDVGLFAQFKLPMVKFAATYFIDSQQEMKNSPAEYGGSGYKLGVGFTAFPLVSLNLDYIVVNYDELTGVGAATQMDLDRKSLLLSVSVPFSF